MTVDDQYKTIGCTDWLPVVKLTESPYTVRNTNIFNIIIKQNTNISYHLFKDYLQHFQGTWKINIFYLILIFMSYSVLQSIEWRNKSHLTQSKFNDWSLGKSNYYSNICSSILTMFINPLSITIGINSNVRFVDQFYIHVIDISINSY